MLGGVEMFCRVLVFGLVTAANVTARQTHTQVDPRISQLQTFLTAACVGLNGTDLVEVGAFRHHQFLEKDTPIVLRMGCLVKFAKKKPQCKHSGASTAASALTYSDGYRQFFEFAAADHFGIDLSSAALVRKPAVQLPNTRNRRAVESDQYIACQHSRLLGIRSRLDLKDHQSRLLRQIQLLGE
jgi:hypothetical protein